MRLVISICGLVSWALWGYTILFVKPEAFFAPLAFYCSLFVGLTCTLARLREAPSYVDVRGVVVPARASLGHGASVTTLLLFALWLQSMRMLTPLNAVLLLLALVFVEIGFALNRGRRPSPSRRMKRVRVPDAIEPAD